MRRKSSKQEFSLITALKELCGEREIEPEILYSAIESALVLAYKKTKGAEKNVLVDIDRETGDIKMFEVSNIVEEVANPATEISLADAQKENPHAELGGTVRKEVSVADFGRIAAQSGGQLVMQKIREAERGIVYDAFNDRAEDVVTGTVERIEDGSIIVAIDKTTGVLVPSEQVRGEVFNIGDRLQAYVAEVRKVGKGPQIYLSRTHPGFLKRLLTKQVPEIQEGIIVIKAIAREAGARSKVAVYSSDENIEPVGTCIGPHGIRIQNILNEIGQERIDVVQWSEDPAKFIAAALAPSRVLRVAVNEAERTSRVVVPDAQLSLAIGKAGQNARLAARLTGWKIDIKSYQQAAEEEMPEGMVETNMMKKKKKKKKKKKFNPQNTPQQDNGVAESESASDVAEVAEVAEVSAENVAEVAEVAPMETAAENISTEVAKVDAENVSGEEVLNETN